MSNSTLKLTEIADPTKLQLALQEMLFNDTPPEMGDVYTDGEHLYGHLVDGEILLWRITPQGGDYDDLKFVLLPTSELAERTILDMLEEIRKDDGWE